MDNRRQLLTATIYRRQARRLRARHSTDPARLYGALRELAHEHDHPQPPAAPRMRLAIDIEPPAPPRVARDDLAEQQFLAEIRANLQDGLLRFSQRQHLLQRADALGLHRFRANLLLAIALHELNPPLPVRVTRLNQMQWLDQPVSASSSDRALKVIGLLDLVMAVVFAGALFGGNSIWPPTGTWDYVALASGCIVFAVCPVLFWRVQRGMKKMLSVAM